MSLLHLLGMVAARRDNLPTDRRKNAGRLLPTFHPTFWRKAMADAVAQRTIDPIALRRAFGTFVTGVTVIT
ncbi:MAG: hypothetical protein E5Y74_27900, partial [Mesorhizobium sp.]